MDSGPRFWGNIARRFYLTVASPRKSCWPAATSPAKLPRLIDMQKMLPATMAFVLVVLSSLVGAATQGVVADTRFNRERGFYDSGFAVVIQSRPVPKLGPFEIDHKPAA